MVASFHGMAEEAGRHKRVDGRGVEIYRQEGFTSLVRGISCCILGIGRPTSLGCAVG